MTTLMIDLPPDLHRRLEKAVAREAKKPAEWTKSLLDGYISGIITIKAFLLKMVIRMAMKTVTVQEAEGHLLELIGLAEQGDEVVITHNDQPKVKLVPLVQPSKKRVFGQHRGKVRMRPDFDDPLPDDFWLSGSP